MNINDEYEAVISALGQRVAGDLDHPLRPLWMAATRVCHGCCEIPGRVPYLTHFTNCTGRLPLDLTVLEYYAGDLVAEHLHELVGIAVYGAGEPLVGASKVDALMDNLKQAIEARSPNG